MKLAPVRSIFSCVLIGLACPLLEVVDASNYSTSYSVILSNAAGVLPNAYGPVSAKVNGLKLSVVFGLNAGTGYTKGNVTANTDTSGRLVTMVKGGQTCKVTYNTNGSVKSVKCTGTRRALRSEEEDEEQDVIQEEVGAMTITEDVHPWGRVLQSGTCDSCVAVAKTAFSTGFAVACSTVANMLPSSSYKWGKKAAAAVCGMTKSAFGTTNVLAYSTCDCDCAVNTDCSTRVCSAGYCLAGKVATGGACPDYEDADCLNAHCAKSSYPSGSTVCCASNLYVYSPFMNATYCTKTMSNTDPCDANSMCKSGVCSDGLCLSSKISVGDSCPDYENADCVNSKCARESYPSGNPICCFSNSSVVSKLLNETFCTATMADNDACDANSMCTSGICSANVCLSAPISTGDFCPDFENADCQNGVCARSSYPSGDAVCCNSGVAIQSLITKEYYCTMTMGTGQPCDQPEMCINGDCSGGGTVVGTCSD